MVFLLLLARTAVRAFSTLGKWLTLFGFRGLEESDGNCGKRLAEALFQAKRYMVQLFG
jgi:hypothetical protein